LIAKILKLSVTNCYLLRADNGYVLIDTGYEWEWGAFRNELKKAGVGFGDLSHLILTHHHDDHAELLNQVVAQNPSIKLVMSTRASELLLKGKNDLSHGAGYLNRRVNALLTIKRLFDKRWTHTFPPYATREHDVMVHQDVPLREIGIGLDGKIIETPGHSTDSISVILVDGDSIVGDAAANFLRFAGTKYCIIYIEDLDQYYRSWIKIMKAGARRIFPAHGGQFAVEELQKHLNRNNKNNVVMVS
jgi:glyoxylase-like metal-dependent hydrolase (beta-lactamase superfamily II)